MNEAESRRRAQLRLLAAVRAHIERLGPVVARITPVHTSYRVDHTFAWAWPPDDAEAGTGITLAFSLARRVDDRRIVRVLPTHGGRLTHHVAIADEADLDGAVDGWLREAYALAWTREPNPLAKRSTASQSVTS
jgi:hypothetical protein